MSEDNNADKFIKVILEFSLKFSFCFCHTLCFIYFECEIVCVTSVCIITHSLIIYCTSVYVNLRLSMV